MRISDWRSDVCSSDLSHRFLWSTQQFAQDLSERPGALFFFGMAAIPHHPLTANHYIAHLTIPAGKQPAIENPIAVGGGQVRIVAIEHQPVGALADFEGADRLPQSLRSEEHTSELQSLMRNSYAVFCLKKKNQISTKHYKQHNT